VRRLGPWVRFAVCLITPPLRLFTRPDWSGSQHVPPGGVILAVNHISNADPFVLADFVLRHLQRTPRFLAKDSLFRGGGVVARTLRGAGQIPVHRDTANASAALSDAVAALDRAECVVIYPEGTVTRDPDTWPMLAKTGVARLALLSGAPVVPVGQWGAQRIVGAAPHRSLRLWPPTRVQVVAGPPVDLSPYAGRELTGDVLRAATVDIMRAVTALVEDLRGASAPTQVHDPRHVVPVDSTDGADDRRTA
jgi:1-acyl-sn-glycerol-3-phosphate acyltransferase